MLEGNTSATNVAGDGAGPVDLNWSVELSDAGSAGVAWKPTRGNWV